MVGALRVQVGDENGKCRAAGDAKRNDGEADCVSDRVRRRVLREKKRRDISAMSSENEGMDRMKGDPLLMEGRH